MRVWVLGGRCGRAWIGIHSDVSLDMDQSSMESSSNETAFAKLIMVSSSSESEYESPSACLSLDTFGLLCLRANAIAFLAALSGSFRIYSVQYLTCAQIRHTWPSMSWPQTRHAWHCFWTLYVKGFPRWYLLMVSLDGVYWVWMCSWSVLLISRRWIKLLGVNSWGKALGDMLWAMVISLVR